MLVHSSRCLRRLLTATEKQIRKWEPHRNFCTGDGANKAGKGNPPLYYIFSGRLELCCPNIKKLMDFPAFADSVTESLDIVKEVNPDMSTKFIDQSGEAYKDVQSAVCTTAVLQVAMYDLLSSMGLTPDGYVGYSWGEYLCGYVDGHLDRKSLLNLIDSVGTMFSSSGKAEAADMADIGVDWDLAQQYGEPKVYPVIHNSPTNTCVCGPPDEVISLIKLLKLKGFSAELVENYQAPAHCSYLPKTYAMFKLMNIKPEGKARSRKWISSVAPPGSVFDSQYITDVLTGEVNFSDAVSRIPGGAVTIELAPYGLLQAFLKEILPESQHLVAIKNTTDMRKSLMETFEHLQSVRYDVNLDDLKK